MKQFKAKTLEKAYEQAAADLQCSITTLDIEIIQQESKGFFGLFAKDAIIEVKVKNKYNKKHKQVQSKAAHTQQNIHKHSSSKKIQKTNNLDKKDEKIFNDFYNNKNKKIIDNDIIIKQDDAIVIEEISTKVNKLFSHTCYKLDKISVSFYDSETIYIEFKGEDAALLIGKEGYRYKALSYILFNWIHEEYKLMLRLEVAQFLTTQEESIYNYLIPVIQTIKDEGFYKTKPLDGVLIHIALKKLRDEFPQKYIAVKTNVKGDKYILVNEYRK